jgi:uncharacterized Zn finger protein
MPFGSVALCLVCPACGRVFDSAMQMEPRIFDAIRLDQPLERCSHCGQINSFAKRDYVFRSTG